jgi:hypothetical protein
MSWDRSFVICLDDLPDRDLEIAAILAAVRLRRAAPAAIQQDALPPTRAANS